MESGANNRPNILEWLENVMFKILDSMKIISETSVNIIVFVMFCAVLSYIAWGKNQSVENKTEYKRIHADTVMHNMDSINFKLLTR